MRTANPRILAIDDDPENLKTIRAAPNAELGVGRGFAVTPKARHAGRALHASTALTTRLAIIVAIVLAIAWPAVQILVLYRGPDIDAVLVNAFWGAYTTDVPSAIVRDAARRPLAGWHPRPPV